MNKNRRNSLMIIQTGMLCSDILMILCIHQKKSVLIFLC